MIKSPWEWFERPMEFLVLYAFYSRLDSEEIEWSYSLHFRPKWYFIHFTKVFEIEIFRIVLFRENSFYVLENQPPRVSMVLESFIAVLKIPYGVRECKWTDLDQVTLRMIGKRSMEFLVQYTFFSIGSQEIKWSSFHSRPKWYFIHFTKVFAIEILE